jgi:hypothetical protein
MKGNTKTSLIIIGLLSVLGPLFYCSEDEVAGPVNAPPVIDSIIADPDAIHPGAYILLTAVAHDPEGDSMTYRWSTYRAAGFFSDSTAPTCTLVVSTVLQGGMFLKITLDVSDGRARATQEKWISIVSGEVVSGHVYFDRTRVPLPAAEVFINRLYDTSSFWGLYSIHHVPPGNVTIYARRPGCEDYSAELNVTDSLTYDVLMTCPDIVKQLSGNVSTYDGTELETVKVTVLNYYDSIPSDLGGITDQNGDFVIDMIPPGKHLLEVSDGGNPDFSVIADTSEVQVLDDMSVTLRGRIERYAFISDGITSPEQWILQTPGFERWLIDTDNQCIAFNSCSTIAVVGMATAEPVAIPPDAKNLKWRLDIDVNEAVFLIRYTADGQVAGDEEFSIENGSHTIERDVVSIVGDLAGSQFTVQFYAFARSPSICCTLCIKKFVLSYYR